MTLSMAAVQRNKITIARIKKPMRSLYCLILWPQVFVVKEIELIIEFFHKQYPVDVSTLPNFTLN